MTKRLLRTIRLDPSDGFVFDKAAEPGEWAVSGAFVFWSQDPDKLEGKARSAFRGGLLGIDSLGWSTLAQIVEASDQDHAEAVALLARRLLERFGAPDMAAAAAAAQEEIAFAASLCNHPPDTLVAVHRTCADGAIRESFRTLRPRGDRKPMRAFAFVEQEGEEEAGEGGAGGETVDLVNLARGDRT
jgi:hypothetical protein